MGSRPAAFDEIEEAQLEHRSLIAMDEQRSAAARETQRLVAKEAGKKDTGLDEAEKMIGKAMISERDMLVVGLALRAQHNVST